MARTKKEGTSEEVFVLTLPLICEAYQLDRLAQVFQCCNDIKNSLISKKLNALRQMERRSVWKQTQHRLTELYAAEKKLTDKLKKLKGLRTAEIAELHCQLKTVQSEKKELFAVRNTLMSEYGMSEYAFQAAIVPAKQHYRGMISIHIAQKIATSVWRSFEAYLFGNGEAVSFSSISDFLTLEGKSNNTGIVFKYEEGRATVTLSDSKNRNRRTVLPVKLSRKDRYGYECEALSRRVHFCKITRRHGKNGWQYFVQLVLAGTPPVKVRPDTGEVLHPLGIGRVGNDIGPQTLAVVSDHTARLFVLAESAENADAKLRRVNRAMDRSRRATNPQMFDNAGNIIPKNKLPPELLTSRGKRKWQESNRYRELKQARRYLYAKVAQERLRQHHELANWLLALGDEHYIEDMNFHALAKRAKKDSGDTEKKKRRKRFGKSITNKAPATFVNIYEQKVLSSGGAFHRINTWEAKASQYNHQTKAYRKKQLSQRWNTMEDGSRIQRDLYSAFLIQNTNDALNGFDQKQLDAKYNHFKQMHDTEINNLKKRITPSSTGVKTIA